MIVIGLIGWIVVASVSFLLRKDPGDMGLLPDGAKPQTAEIGQPDKANGTQLDSVSLSQAFGTGNFWFLGLLWLLSSVSLRCW